VSDAMDVVALNSVRQFNINQAAMETMG
jgi:hypothetical protein